MYVNGYGNNILLFLLGGLAGTTMIYLMAKWLDSLKMKVVVDISNGTIIILGFHAYLISIIRDAFPTPSLWDAVYALLIVLVFIPIIWIVEKKVPCLMGKYRVGKRHY